MYLNLKNNHSKRAASHTNKVPFSVTSPNQTLIASEKVKSFIKRKILPKTPRVTIVNSANDKTTFLRAVLLGEMRFIVFLFQGK